MNLDTMTVAQRAAVESDAERILCVAGPGSGKTTVLAQRIRRLIDDGVAPEEIVALTYTNAAARNLEERLGLFKASPNGDESVPFIDAPIRLGFCGTLHGFALRMLKRHGADLGYGDKTGVIDEEASLELLAAKAKLLNVKTPLAKLAEMKKKGKPTGVIHSKEGLVVLAYCDELKEAGLLDFDLILTEFFRMLNDPIVTLELARDYSYFFVDERQDSAAVDCNIFAALPIRNKFSVGDPDQAIYGFRGGRPDLMRDYSTEAGVETILLEANFRCGVQICEAATRLIGRNTNRIDKGTYSADLSPASVVRFGQTENEGDEIAQVVGFVRDAVRGYEPEEIAILARTNAIAAAFRDAVEAAGITVEAAPKSDLPADWSLARALVEFLAQPANDTLAFFYLIARSTVKEGWSALDARKKAAEVRRDANRRGVSINEQWFKFPSEVPLAEVGRYVDREGLCVETRMLVLDKIKALPAGAGLAELALEVAKTDRPEAEPAGAGVTVATIHAAKGREWEVVFLVGFEDEVIPGAAKSADVEEERRVAFVGLTRARKAVYISHAASRRANWGNRPIVAHKPSRFLAEIFPGELP